VGRVCVGEVGDVNFLKMIRFTLFFTLVFLIGNNLCAQTDFPALKQQFLDYRKADKQDSALFIARKMNNLALKEQTDTSFWYALSLRYIGNPMYTKREYDSTLVYWLKSLNILEKYHPKLKTDKALVLNGLGNLYSNMANYNEAEKCFFHSLNIVTLENDIQAIAKNLNNLGNLYSTIGNYDSSLNYYKKSLSINERNQYDFPEEYAKSLFNLGLLYSDLAEYKDAEENIKKAMDIFIKISGVQSLFYSYCNNGLGVVFWKIGEYNEAIKYYRNALQINVGLFGERSIDVAFNLFNIGEVYLNMNQIDSAEFYFNQTTQIFNEFLEIGHPYFMHLQNAVAKILCKKNELNSAIDVYNKVINIGKKKFAHHEDLAESYLELAKLYLKMLNYQSSESNFHLSLENYTNLFSDEHPFVINCQNQYTKLLNATDRREEAYIILNKNFTKKSTQIADNFEWLNDSQKEAYWKKESEFFDQLSWFANEAYEKVPEATGLNYNSALVTKSKMLETKISSENYYREVDELREELAYRRRLLAKMESEGSTEKDRLDKLHKEADSLDKRLTLSWPEYAQQKKNLSITWDQVQQNLEKGEAAIEFVRFKNEEDSLYYYNALVLKKGDSNPTLIKLCKEEELTAISPKMGYSAYYPIIWQPLESALVGIKTIYYAPTGELYNVPFHALYAPKGKGDEVLAAKTDKRGVIIQNERAATEQNAEYLMDRYTMHQLTSTRYLAMGLKQKEKEKIGNNMAMVGGVNYDYLPGTQSAAKNTKKNKNASRSSESASGKLAYLEGTKTEVEQIASSVTPNNWQATLLENNDATEEKIIKLENKEAKSILHIATHGYAFPEYDFNDTTISENSLRYSYRYSTNPMVRSGLILAGGNWAWTGSDTLTKLGAEQNGILTALEVSQLNLKKTKLVVLSACETGLGKIEGSEGTFGLKRGLKLAGVEQMIVSLWSVPDKETMELMTLFYSDLTKSLNPVTSFEKAQKEMRNKYPTDPEKWAGFVLVR
jgi:CHAT domain-containing protein/tetratricopeptide (TPR) repeat protein